MTPFVVVLPWVAVMVDVPFAPDLMRRMALPYISAMLELLLV
jgi:hypothetical protein